MWISILSATGIFLYHNKASKNQGYFDICRGDKVREKCPYSEFFWSVFSRIRTEYGEISCISPCSARMRENTDNKNSEYGHFSRSDRKRSLARNAWNITINPFVPNAPFLYPLKTSENLTVSDVFRGSRKGASGTNGLIRGTLMLDGNKRL